MKNFAERLAYILNGRNIGRSDWFNKTVVITGTLSMDRRFVIDYIRAAGGRVRSTVTSKTDYLVVGTNPGGNKRTRAVELGIPVINERQLWDLYLKAKPIRPKSVTMRINAEPKPRKAQGFLRANGVKIKFESFIPGTVGERSTLQRTGYQDPNNRKLTYPAWSF